MKTLIATLAFLPVLVFAAEPVNPEFQPLDGPPAFGLSGNVAGHRMDTDDSTAIQTKRMLKEQADSTSPEKSEISAPIYVQSQKRLKDSFDKPIPDFSKEQTRGNEGGQ